MVINRKIADSKESKVAKKNFKTFEDLEIYKRARAFRIEVYKLIKGLPKEERYSLDPQMRRSIVSVTNNIAEGHGRYYFQENIQFCRQSRGSLEEIIDDINVCIDEGYGLITHLDKLKIQSYDLLKGINGYIKYLKCEKEKSGV
ncbi:MAG: four helix bundle protein [bacterium]